MSWIPTDRPLVFGHRGGSRLAPENTIAAFDRAVAEGVDGLELDVRLSKDGQVVVCHDARVDRTSNTTGAIADMTASELERVDAGYRFRSDALTYPFRWRGFGVPRLADVLARYPRHPFIVEMKDNTRAMAEATVEVIRAAGALDRVCLGAFQLRVLTTHAASRRKRRAARRARKCCARCSRRAWASFRHAAATRRCRCQSGASASAS